MAGTRFQPLAGYSNDEEPLHFSNDITDTSTNSEKSMRARNAKLDTFDEPVNEESKPRRRSIWSKSKGTSKVPFPWQHQTATSKGSATSRVFSHARQGRRIISYGLLQWLLTLTLVLGQFASLYCYSGILALTPGNKHAFNALIIIFSSALSLAVVSALRTYMKLLKWPVMASRYHNLQQIELLMHSHEQSKAFQLLWKGRTTGRFSINRTQVLCIISLVLFAGLNVTIGLLGLTYSVDTTYDRLNYEWGNVSLVDLSNIYSISGDNFTSLDLQTGAANSFGLIGQSYWLSASPLISSGVSSKNGIYTYNLTDVTADTSKSTTSATSDRQVSGEASCTELQILRGGVPAADTTNGELEYRDERGETRTIAVYGIANLTSTWISDTSVESTCGPRCANILILNSGSRPDSTIVNGTQNLIGPRLFACNSTVSQVTNFDTCTYDYNCTMRDRIAQYIAGAIGFSGEGYTNNSLQYRSYPHGHVLSWDGNPNVSTVVNYQAQIGAFSMCVVNAMDNVGPRFVVEGWYPAPSVYLSVKWPYAIPVLCVLPVVQLAMLFFVAAYTKSTLVKDSGYLAAAQLLRPIVAELSDRGSALTSDEIAEQMQHMQVVYGVRNDQSDYRIDLVHKEEVDEEKPGAVRQPSRKFPEGHFD